MDGQITVLNVLYCLSDLSPTHLCKSKIRIQNFAQKEAKTSLKLMGWKELESKGKRDETLTAGSEMPL